MLNICTVEEGRISLKNAQLIEPEDMLDSDILAGVLVQILLFLGLSQVARDAMRMVVLLMVQSKQARVEDAAAEGIVDRVVDRLADVVKAATQVAVAEIKSALSVLAESSTQMAATATSYQDTLTSKVSGFVPIFVRPSPSLSGRPHLRPAGPTGPTGPYRPLSHSLSRTLVCFYYPSLLGTFNSP